MSAFSKYRKIEINTKTIILYRTGLSIVEFESIDPINQTGLDTTWIGIETNRNIMIIGSIYHSPSYECDYRDIKHQMNQIKDITKNYNHVTYLLAGDFNAKHQIWGSTITDERGIQLNDWITSNKLSFMNDGTHTHTSLDKKEVLDITMISQNDMNLVKQWFVQDIPTNILNKKKHGKNSDETDFSDHRGIIMIINSDPKIKVRPNRITWNLDIKLVSKFNDELKEKMKEWKMAYDKLYHSIENVDLLVEYFQLIIVDTARRIFGFKKFCDDSVNWIDKKIHRLLEKKRKLGNNISHEIYKIKKKFGSIENASKYRKSRLKKQKKKLRKVQKKLRKKKRKNILLSTENIERLINNTNINKEKLFFNTYNKIAKRQSTHIPPLRDPSNDEIIAQTDMEIANKLHDYYSKKLDRNKYEKRHEMFHNYVESVMENYETNKNDNNNIVNRKFTEQEVLRVLNCINVQSAMAFDYIHYQLLVWSKFIILTNLTLLFNLVFVIHQYCPKAWKCGEIVPVPKPGRVPYYCKNIRPISILPGLGRIIGKLHCNRLLTDCIKRKILSKTNCAFQCNRGSDDIYNNLTESILQALQNGHFLELGFKDLQSAYDSVWIEGLLYRMKNEYGYDGNIIAWYLSFFN